MTSMNNTNHSVFQRLLEVESAIISAQQTAKQLREQAALEALDIESKNRVVFRNGIGKIVLKFLKRFPKIEEDKELSRIDADIKSAELMLVEKHSLKLNLIAKQIDEYREAIAKLEEQREELLSSQYLNALKARFKHHYQACSYQVPSVQVFIEGKPK